MQLLRSWPAAPAALKHHTSKISDFSDLSSVETFGFRGEALSSLCALSDVKISTCTEGQEVGTVLEYDKDGKLVATSACAHKRGTTVSLANLFAAWPVRVREFKRNIKREFAKMVQLLQAYCLVRPDVRFSCTNQTGKGGRSNVLSTPGGKAVSANVATIFGHKQLKCTMKFVPRKPDDGDATEATGVAEPYSISGYVSKPAPEAGRSSTDRQFLSINKRPCDHSKLSKAVNEVYRQFVKSKYPFVVLDLSLPRQNVDVNITPDKRAVLMQRENALIDFVKESLRSMWEPSRNTFTRVTATQESMAPFLSVRTPSAPDASGAVGPAGPTGDLASQAGAGVGATPRGSLPGAVVPQPSHDADGGKATGDAAPPDSAEATARNQLLSGPTPPASAPGTVSGQSSLGPCETAGDAAGAGDTGTSELAPGPGVAAAHPGAPAGSGRGKQVWSCQVRGCVKYRLDLTCKTSLQAHYKAKHIRRKFPGPSWQPVLGHPSRTAPTSPLAPLTPKRKAAPVAVHYDDEQSPWKRSRVDTSPNPASSKTRQPGPAAAAATGSRSRGRGQRRPFTQQGSGWVRSGSKHDPGCACCDPTAPGDAGGGDRDARVAAAARLSGLSETELSQLAKTSARPRPIAYQVTASSFLPSGAAVADPAAAEAAAAQQFTAKIGKSSDAEAEAELSRVISKEDFAKMEILGQFNLGFMVVRRERDLFIIDQHASDEKYNFERLQRDTVMQTQRMVVPKKLELTAVNEDVLMDNIDIFQKNGFDFVVDENATPTKRVRMSQIPLSKGTVFGASDVDELIFMLSESPGVMCRPSRVRSMFASRSCRSSVMIGTALDKSRMRELVDHMGTMEQPWNCPHGRPTMRHIFDLRNMPAAI